jgi:hypothetical protein
MSKRLAAIVMAGAICSALIPAGTAHAGINCNDPDNAKFCSYPQKSLIRGYKQCEKENGDTFLLYIRSDTYARGESGPFSDWHYVRSRGKLVFENGFLDRRYGKVRKYPPGYASPVPVTLRNRNDGSLFARCVPTGGPS